MDIRNVKNIIFDFGGVLVDLDKSRCVEAFTRLGFSQAAQWVDTYSQQGVFGRLETGTITPEEFCEEIRRLTGCMASDDDMWQAWNLLLDGIPAYRLDALIELKRHFNLYLLSNTNEPHWQHASERMFPHRDFRVEDYFLQIFLSYEMHQVKPDAAIFRSVLEQTGILPEETLFIDDAAANCETARTLGLLTYCPAPKEDWRKLFDGIITF